jgi:hypothetical protein
VTVAVALGEVAEEGEVVAVAVAVAISGAVALSMTSKKSMPESIKCVKKAVLPCSVE